MKVHADSSDENDDEDESEVEDNEDPPVVIDKSKKSSFHKGIGRPRRESRGCMGSTSRLSSEEELD